MATSFLQIDNLTKSYGDRMLFDGVTFGVYEGDKIGVIAKNGTGKSTLLNIIAALKAPTRAMSHSATDSKVGILEQTPRFAPGSSIMDACLLGDNAMCHAIAEYETALLSGDNDRLNEAIRHGRRIGMGLRGQDEAAPRPTESARHNGVDRQSFGRTGQESGLARVIPRRTRSYNPRRAHQPPRHRDNRVA